MIAVGNSKETKVEVYLLNLKVLETTKDGAPVTASEKNMSVSAMTKVSSFKAAACKLFDLSPKEVRVWNYYSNSSQYYMSDESKTLEDEKIVHDQRIVLEKQRKDRTWPKSNREIKKKGFFANIFGSSKDELPVGGGKHLKGLCGLHNLGVCQFLLFLI